MTLSTCCRHSSTNRTNPCVLWRKSSHLPVRPSSDKTVHKPKFCQIKTCLFLPPLSSLKRCKSNFLTLCIYGGKGWLGFLDLWFGQKPWWNWYLTPVMNFGDVWRAQLAQFHSPHFHVGAPGIFSDLLRLFRCWRDSGVHNAMGSYHSYSIPGKTTVFVPEFAVVPLLAVKDLPLGRTLWCWWCYI